LTAPSEGQQWGNFVLLKMSAYGFGMVGFVLAMDTIVLPILIIEVAPAAWKNTYLAVLGFSGLLVAGLIQPFVGRASDQNQSRLGRRIPYMLWGSAFVCLGLIGLGFTTNYPTLFVIWLFMQTNINIGYGPYQALIRDLVPLSRVGVASSIKILSDATGSLVLIAICSSLIGRASNTNVDKWIWLSLGAIAIALVLSSAITNFTVYAREKAARLAEGAVAAIDAPTQELHPQLSRFVLSRLLIMTGITAFPTFGLFYLRDAVGIENAAQALGGMIIVVGGALALTIYPAGWLSDKIGRKPVIMAGALGAAGSSIWLIWASDVTGVLIIASCIGASIGVLLSSNWALANELGTRGREGLHMGIVNLATTGGSALAKVMGPGIDLLNNQVRQGAGYDALLITCSTLFLLGAFLLMPLKVVQSPAIEQPKSPGTAG